MGYDGRGDHRHGGPAEHVSPAEAQAQGRDIQIIGVNDFHGNLDALPGAAGAVTAVNDAGQQEHVQAGGIARMATLIKKARQGQERSIVVGAGDMIGGSPLMSATYHDEPAIHALEAMGVEVTSVGNHEFDEGLDELKRIADGGCHAVDGCAVPGEEYPGAQFEYLAANVTEGDSDRPVLPPYWVKDFGGVKVGFIGLTTKDTPLVVAKSAIRGLRFADEVQTIDRYARQLDGQGVKAIVALVHEGGEKKSPLYDFDCDAKGPASGLSGRIETIAEQASPLVDLVISAHSHEPYVCEVSDPAGQRRLLTQAASFGRAFTDIRLRVDGRGDVIRDSVEARNKIVTLNTVEDPQVKDVVETWRQRSAKVAGEPVGYVSQDIFGRESATPETPLGNLLADAQLEATKKARAEVALMNVSGIRADITHTASGSEGDGVVTYGEAYQVQPFDNMLVTLDMTGEQLLGVLREQYSGAHEEFPVVLQQSSTMTYTVDMSLKGADRVVADSIEVNGKPLDPQQVYKVTVNAFLAGGGLGFQTFTQGTNRVNGVVDLEAFVAYFKAHSSPDKPMAAPATGRVTYKNAT